MQETPHDPPLESLPTVVRGRFREFDQFAETLGTWGLSFQQLDRGPSPTQWMQIAAPGIAVQHVALSRHYAQAGEAPAGMRSFALLTDGSSEVGWCGRSFQWDHLAAFSPAREFSASSRPGFSVWTVSIDEGVLADLLAERGVDLERNLPADAVLQLAPARIRALRQQLSGLFADAARGACRLDLAGVQRGIAAALAEPWVGHEERPQRASVVEAALRLVHRHRREPLPIGELAQRIGTSWRTLDYAFREQLGVTPKSYQRAYRLNGAHRELRRPRRGVRVSDVAHAWGFWHMGQFAADYHGLFGEVPSQTLADSRRRVANS